MNNRMSDLYSGLGSFVQPRRMQEGGQALTDLQKNVLAEQGLTPAEAQNAVRMIIAGQSNMLAPNLKGLLNTGYFRRVGEAFNMVDASGQPITLGGATAVAGIDFPGQTIEYGPSAEQLAQMEALRDAAAQNYTFGTPPPADNPPADSPPADAPPADTPAADTPATGYTGFNVFEPPGGRDNISYKLSFEKNYGPAPVTPGAGASATELGRFNIDTANYNRARNLWNSMRPADRAKNFFTAYGKAAADDAARAMAGYPGTTSPGTTQGSNTLPAASNVVGDLFPDPTERVMPTMDMVRQQSLEGPMLSGNFLDTRQNPQVYQLPTQGYASQRQDPFGVNVKQTTRPLNIPERIIPDPPRKPLPEETGMANPTQGGVTN